MSIETETESYTNNSITYRVRRPENPTSSKVTLLLHGWTGNEKVMWVFARAIPRDRWVLAPRGLYESEEGGFGWTPSRSGLQAPIQDFFPAIQELQGWITEWAFQERIQNPILSLVGFSQGAALAYTYGLTPLQPVTSIAGLSGFVPLGSESYVQALPLAGVPVFVAHGTQDETVSVERAREGVQILQQAGAKVTYCESDVGHKLGANCMRSLAAFYQTNQ